MTYSAKVLDHFRHPRHAGELTDASAVAEGSNPVCGDVIKLWLKVEHDRVTAASFQAAGCVPAIACGSWLAERMTGCSLDELRRMSPGDVETGLDGLPAPSKHAPQLVVEVLEQVLKSLESASNRSSEPRRP